MTRLHIILFPFVMLGCANQPTQITKLHYGEAFELSVPSKYVSNATIFSFGELSLKTKAGHLLSGLMISNELESFPDDFSIHHYPEYLLGIRKTSSLNTPLARLFENSSKEIDDKYGVNGTELIETPKSKIYLLCKLESCLSYIVKEEIDAHILTLHGEGFKKSEFVALIKGI